MVPPERCLQESVFWGNDRQRFRWLRSVLESRYQSYREPVLDAPLYAFQLLAHPLVLKSGKHID